MSRVRWMSGVIAVAMALVCSPAFATAYTSNNTGDWSVPTTWTPTGVPTLGDTVTITGSHVVTVSDARSVDFITFLNNSGGKELHVTSTGNLTVAGSGAAIQLNPSTDGTNLLRFDGGTVTLTDPLGSVNVQGGGLSLARIQFTSLGGTLIIGRSLNFSGSATNAQLQFDAGSAGSVEIGGDLSSGGSISTAGSASTFTFNGTAGQIVNGYNFQNLTIDKSSSTATLNGAITVNGNLTITDGVLDDGGNQISLNAGSTSTVTIGTNGVLKLGSSGSATFFPQPVTGANVFLSPNAAVVYQSGANSQSVNIDVAYQRLFLQAPGSTGPVDKAIGSGTIKVQETLQIDDNGANGVRLVLGPETLDVDGDISGNGEILITSGSIFVGGNFASTIAFTLAGTGSTVTYDGTGSQSVLGGANYDNLVVNKAAGTATITGPLSLNDDLVIAGGTLDDDGIQILLDSGNGSSVSICSTCTLKLGSATSGTNFPSPVLPANLTLAPGSTVVYQAGVPQTVDTSFNYRNLSLLTLAGNVVRSFVNQAFSTVLETFHIGAGVTATFDNDILDVDGDITGSGTVQLIDGIIDGEAQVGGNWSSGTLIAEPGTQVTYDGAGAQSMLPATYARLHINKPSGAATAPSGTTIVQEAMNLTSGNVVVNGSFTIDVGATVTRISGHFIGPLTMGLNLTPIRRFDVGTATSYMPVDVDAGSAGLVTIQAVQGLHPNSTGVNTLDRYWSIVAPSTVTPLDSVQFNYNDPGDITNGTETRFRLAQYSGGIWTDFGDIPETLNYGLATTPAPYLGDWVIGQKGSTGFAGRLAITSVNGGTDPGVGAGFPVEVESQHDNGNPANVTVNTGVDILLQTGGGSLSGGFASITAGTSSATASDSTYDTIESNIQLRADASSGDTDLDDGVSATFDVVALPSVLTVSSIADTGAGSLREAITTFNSGGCASPCDIEFDVNGTGNIVLASQLPAITGTGPLTINGYSGFGAAVNTNPFGQPLNSVITVSLDGNNVVALGLVIQTPDVTVRGLGFRGFSFGGTGEAIKIDNVDGCTIAGNYIGTDNAGTAAQPNFFGVVLFGSGATGNAIGGVANDDRNLIAGNTSWGVLVTSGATLNDILGNYIGIRADGATGLGNGSGGVQVCATCQDTIVGTTIVGNVISGHTSGAATGIELLGVMGDVRGNRIGTTADGMGQIANNNGIVINGNDNSIGGTSPADLNLISGNLGDGITVNSNDNEISNNWIGTDATGTAALPNTGHGILLTGAAANNKIGSPQPNRIAFNQDEGVEVGTTGIGNTIQTNEIYSNLNLAIDLGANGATPNDATDADTGANNLQNFPTISLAEINGLNVDVTVSLDSSAGVNADYFVVDVYRADASVTPQAAEHLGASACIDTLSTGIFTNQLVSVPKGTLTVGGKVVVTATAFSDSGCTTVSEGTSELSPGVTVNGDVHWINGSGGAWENGANWDTGLPPGSGDNAIIDAGGTYTVTLSSSQTVQSLTVGNGISGVQTLSQTGGPLTLNAASTVTSTGFFAAANSIAGTGSLTNNGTMTWSFGTISLPSVTNNTVNFTISGANPKTLNGTTLTNSATGGMSWSGGALNFASGGGINNAGSFLVAVDHIVGDAGSGGAFANSGTFTKQGVSGSTTFNVPFNHTGGQVNVQNGFLTLSGGGSATAPIDISATKKILVSGAYTFGGSVSLTGTGKVEVGAGGTLTVNTAVNFPGLHLNGGTVNGTGDVGATTGGQIVWDSGTFSTGGGKVSLSGSGNIQISTAGSKTLNRTLELISPTAIAVWNNGTIDIGTNGLVNNGGTFESQADTILNNSGVGTATITNTGTFRKSATTGGQTLFQNVELVSSGTLQVAAGTVNLANATISGTTDIDVGALLMVDSHAVTLNAPSLIDTGLLQVAGGTLTMNGPFTVPTFQFDSGTVDGTGTVTHNGSFAWSGGTLSGSGTTAIGTGGSLSIANFSAKTLDRALDVQLGQTATWSGGTINLGTNGAITNGGTFVATTDETLNKSAGGTPTLTNTGTLRKSGGAASTTFTNVALNSTGTIHVQTGTLNLANASVSGIVDLDPGTKIAVDSDVVTIAGATSFVDTGSVDVQGGTLTVSNNVTVPALNFNSGVVDGAATLTIGSTGVWGGGTMQGSGVTEVANLATLTMTGIAKSLNTRTLRPLSGSTVNWNAGTLNVNTGGNIDNTGLFHVQFDGNIGNAGSAGGFVNNNGGTLRKSATTGSLTLTNINLTNNGILDIDLGRVDVTGTFIQGATGSLDVLLGGVVPGTQHGQLVTNSGPTLAGPLNITFNGPYQPLVNDDFAIISWPSDTHAGNFAPYNLPVLSNGRTWSNFFSATGLHLVVNGGNADLSIVKTASAPNVVVGNPIVYTLAVSNAGPDSANSVQVTDTLPAGHTGISAGGGPTWSCGVVGLVVTCNATSALNTGAAPNITVNATAPVTPGPITNTASVTTSNPDPNGTNDSSNAIVTIDAAQADLAVTGTDPAGVPPGSPVAFNFTITNNGPQTANAVIFTAPIPSTLTFVSATPPCTFSAGVVTCNLGNLAASGFTAVTINTTASSVGTQNITGSADANETDPTAANDSKTLAVAVSGGTVVVTNTNDSGAGSLRQAMLDAQNSVCTSPCFITFNIPGAAPFVIQPATPLPSVGNNTHIDGTTQPGYGSTPVVEIDGSLLITSPGTLVLGGTNATLSALSVTNATAGNKGIAITGNANNVVRSYVGVAPLGGPAANDVGISITGSNNIIGGTSTADANVIANNANSGVIVTGSGIGNAILGNSIHSNVQLGIDLNADGPTPNDAGDADTGPDNLQNSPTITSATLDGLGGMTINSNIDSSSASAGSILLEYFEADAGGEGQTFIVSACVAGNSFALGTSFAAPAFISAGDSIVGTATAYSDASCTTVADGTSEFSNVIAVTNCTPPPATLSAPASVCSGATNVPANVVAPSAVSYLWLITNGTIVSGQGTSAITFNPNASGSVGLGVTVTDAVGCVSNSSTSIPITPLPVVNITGPAATCAGSPVVLDAGPGASWLWNTSETTQTITVSPTSTQVYSVTLTDANGCSASDTHTVTVSSNPVATITAPSSVCESSTGNNASVPTQAGATYSWTITNGVFTSAASGPGVTFTAAASGNVGLSVTITVGSCTSVGNTTVPIVALPVATISGPAATCANSTGNNASVPTQAGATYAWTITNGVFTSATNGPGVTFTAGPSGNVALSVTVTVGSCTNTGNATVPIMATPVVNITGPAATCAGAPVVLDAGPFASWAWNTGATTQTITVSPTSTQTYSVVVTDANGCSGSDSHVVTVSSNPVATITAPPSVCENSTGNNASVPTQAGATYAWTITNGVFTSAANGPGVTFTAAASGNVGLGVTITAGSCTSVGNTTVPIGPPPVVTISGPTQVCPNVPFSLSAGAGFGSYLWSNGATSQSIVVSQNTPTEVYTVTVSNGAGCSSTDNHTVTLSNGPSATITAPSSVLANTAGHLASVPAQPGATYFWAVTNGSITGGQGTDSVIFAVNGSGVTQLSVEIALSGCSAIGTHNVTVGGPVSTLADVGITKSAASSVQPGGTLEYTLTVTNNGPGNAPSVTIVDPLPNGTTLVSIDDGNFNCSSFANGIVCEGSLFPGSSALIIITVTAPLNVPPQGLTLTNTASVDAGSNDTNASNDVATAQTLVVGAPSACTSIPPSLLSPANGATTSSPVTFSWSAVSGFVDAYELWIVTGDTTSLAGTTNGTSLTIPLANGEAGWYVIARMAGDCPPLVSAQRTVNVLLANGCATHTAPQLTSPAANSTLTSPVSFAWTPVPQAIGYRVWVAVNGTAAQDVGTTDGAITLTADVPPGAIAVHVDALFSGCPETSSAVLPFTVARPDPCAGRTTVTPLAPQNNATLDSSVVSFAWSEADADGYRLWVSVDGAPAEVLATTDETSLQTTIAHGVVEWWIELLYDGCGSTESQHFRFTIPQRQSCTATVPQLILPANGSTRAGTSVTFDWTSVPDAVQYELWLSVGDTTPTLIGATDIMPGATSLTRLVPPGALEWFVRAIVDRCPARDSATSRFTVTPAAACGNDQPPHAIAPLPGAQVVSPVDFAWTPRPGALSYDLFVVYDDEPQFVLSTPNAFANDVVLSNGNLHWFVRAQFGNCSPHDSAARELEVVGEPQPCADLVPPVISAPGQISNGEPFLVQWSPIPGATAYQLQTADNSAFANAELLTTGETSATLTRSNQGSSPLGVFARVRALDSRCSPPTITPYGPTGAIFILPESGSEGSAPLTGGIVTHVIQLGPELAGQSFVVTVKEPWLSVAPSSGVVAAGGTPLVVTADTTALPLGTSLGSVQIALTSSARGVGTQATTFKIPTMSVSKVTPVTPAPKSTPPPDALIIPAVAHANGINSQFQSDVRVTNSSARLLDYQATFTPSGSDGLSAGRQTTFSIEPGRTIALDDVLRGWFGTGGESVTGTLEVRPITETAPSTSSAAVSGLANLVTFAASRTFNVTANGTFGQYIPAIPFANFIGGSDGVVPPVALSLQQIAQSERYRTNLGIVEASGDPASLLVKVFGGDGQKLTEFPVQLAGGQHTQLNSFLSTQGVGSLADGRVEISVVGGNGKVTAYASVLDNATSDPLLVTPVTLSDAGNTKWVIPGVADLNNGIANWQTDMRLFNAGTAAVDAVLTFYSQNGGTPQIANVNIPAGQVRQFDKTLASVFGKANDGGAVHIATPAASRLVATARTYNQTTGGTYGQFISGVTPNEATGHGDRPLQILQVEESNRFRSNVGLAEVTGKPVKLEITVVPPDAKITAVTEVQLQANEFRQINSLLRSVGLADTYNARVSVRVIEGEGRVTAYASVIDMLTNDPTYVPAQ